MVGYKRRYKGNTKENNAKPVREARQGLARGIQQCFIQNTKEMQSKKQRKSSARSAPGESIDLCKIQRKYKGNNANPVREARRGNPRFNAKHKGSTKQKKANPAREARRGILGGCIQNTKELHQICIK